MDKVIGLINFKFNQFKSMDYIISILTNKWVMLNNIIGILILEWSYTKLKPLFPKNEEDRLRDEKYPAYKRNDLHKIGRLYMYPFMPFIFLKAFLGCGGIFLCSVVIFCISLTHKRGDPYHGWKLWVVKYSCRAAARIVLYMLSCYYLHEK